MTEDVQRHIFEPFFTTKGMNKGTGLGLATVYGIVKQSDAFIWVYSEVGHGTAFKVYFPRSVAADSAPNTIVPVDDISSGTGTILLVEDEEPVRRGACRILSRAGYTVLEARHGAEALEIVGRWEHEIDLVVTDVVMPVLGGRELVTQLERLQPQVPVIYMSGYIDDTVGRTEDIVSSTALFLQKPFSPQNLLAAVQDALAPIPSPSRG